MFLKGISNLIKKWKFKFCKPSKAFCMNLSHIIDLKSHLRALHQGFAKWRKVSDPSLMGVSSYIFTQLTQWPKITQIVRPLIHGRFIKILQNDANRPTLHLWVLASFCIKILMKLPINEGSDALRHFTKVSWSAHEWGVRQFASFENP